MTFLLERVLRLSEQFFHCLCEKTIQKWIRFNSSGNFKGARAIVRQV